MSRHNGSVNSLPGALPHDSDLACALQVARLAGALVSQRPAQLLTYTKSSVADVVTQMDKACEDLVVSEIVQRCPGDGIVGEEGSQRESFTGRTWVLDPIDGTTNYVYNLPHWCVSIGLRDITGPLVGVVSAPALDTTFAAARGQGAWRRTGHGDWQRLSVSVTADMDRALIGTGFGYTQSRRSGQARVLRTVLPKVRDIRRLGSCALDMCMVAEGSLDAYFERGVHDWDYAAGELIAVEAGARVTGLRGQGPGETMVVAGNAMIHGALVAILEECDADSDRP